MANPLVRSVHSLIVASACFALLACTGPSLIACPDGLRIMVIDTLYFGLSLPSGSISSEEWRRFIDTEVTPRFREGLSFWPATGQWKSEAGPIIRESSYVLTLVHPDSESTEAAVASIMNSYKVQFSQEAVLRVRGNSCVSF